MFRDRLERISDAWVAAINRETGPSYRENVVSTIDLLQKMLIHEGFDCDEGVLTLEDDWSDWEEDQWRQMFGLGPLVGLVGDIKRMLRVWSAEQAA